MPSQHLPGFKRQRNRFTVPSQQAPTLARGAESSGNTGPQQAQRAPQTLPSIHQSIREGDEHRVALQAGSYDQPASGAHGTSGGPVAPVAPVAGQRDQGFSRNRLVREPVAEACKPVAKARPQLPPESIHARLCAAGATVRTYGTRDGAMVEIEAPAGIPAELVREVEKRGWRIIPGGKPNPEAEHDSWLAGVPVSEFSR